MSSAVLAPRSRSIFAGCVEPLIERFELGADTFAWVRKPEVALEVAGLPNAVSAVAVSPDEKTCAFGFVHGEVLLVNESGLEPRTFGRGIGSINALRFHPDGKRLLVSADRACELWDASSGRALRRFGERKQNGGFLTAFSSDGRLLANINAGLSFSIFEVETGAELACVPGGDWTALAFGPGAATLAVGKRDGTVTVWALGR
jgi:WD40 repeat protein